MIRWDDEHQRLHVGDRVWIAQRGIWTDYDIPGDGEWKIIRERQVVVSFESGWNVSVIWGDMTYSSNHDARWGKDWCGNVVPPFTDTPEVVEVGVMRRGLHLSGDPFSYVNDFALNVLLDQVQTLPSTATDEQVQDLLTVDKLLDSRPEVLTQLQHNERPS